MKSSLQAASYVLDLKWVQQCQHQKAEWRERDLRRQLVPLWERVGMKTKWNGEKNTEFNDLLRKRVVVYHLERVMFEFPKDDESLQDEFAYSNYHRSRFLQAVFNQENPNAIEGYTEMTLDKILTSLTERFNKDVKDLPRWKSFAKEKAKATKAAKAKKSKNKH